MTQEQTRQTSGQAEDKRTSKEGRKRDKSRSKEDKKKGKHKSKRTRKRTKEDKIEANTPQAFKPPNSTRAQKPHNPRKAPKQHKPPRTPQNALRTTKRAMFASNQTIAKQESGQKAGNTARKQDEPQEPITSTLKTQIYLKFCPFWSPKIPRKHQSTPKKNSLLPLFAENLPRWTENWRPERMKAGRTDAPLLYAERA